MSAFAVACKSCGFVEDKAWKPATSTEHSKRTDEPLSPRGQVPVYCPRCGNRNWEVPAKKETVEKYEAQQRREARAAELTAREDFDGIFKIPEEVRASREVKLALSNLLGPLEGEALKAAQRAVLTISHSGMAADSTVWIEYFDRAIQRATQNLKGAAVK